MLRRRVCGFIEIILGDGDLILPIEPPAQVDQFAPLAAERERRLPFGILVLAEFDGLAADGAGGLHGDNDTFMNPNLEKLYLPSI